MKYETIQVRFQAPVCFIRFNRPESHNAIHDKMIYEISEILSNCGESITIIVLEGMPDVFCLGADFRQIEEEKAQSEKNSSNALYDLWLSLAEGPYITIAHVRGKANAGGVGFAVACDLVIADHSASFSLSELLFGLYPACVMPFLIRRIGFAKANYMALTTKQITAAQAANWGLVDVIGEDSGTLLRQYLLRLRRLSSTGIRGYKSYMSQTEHSLKHAKNLAVQSNLDMFSDPLVLSGIDRFNRTRKFPWEE